MKNYIDGKRCKASGEIFMSVNPANGECMWEGRESTKVDVDTAVEAASRAFETWSLLGFDQRVEYLERYRSAIEEYKEEFSLLLSEESGKPRWESLLEIGAMLGKLAISIKAYEERCPFRTTDAGNARAELRFRPIGVMGVLGPFNLPVHLPNGHIVPALLAGNTIVFKPSEQTPACAAFMVELFVKAGFPAGVINLIQGARLSGEALASHDKVNGILFTGSYRVGRLLHEQCAGKPEKMLALEMGGNNPLVVDEVKDLKAAAYSTIQSAFITAGQRCVCARRLIVPRGDAGDRFIAELCTMTEKIDYGDPAQDPEPFIGTLISQEAADFVIKARDDLLSRGAKELVVMIQSEDIPALLSPGIIDVTGLELGDEEVFGPLLQVVRVDGFDAAVKESNRTAFGLSAGLISDNVEKYDIFLKASRAGIINWNRQITGAVSFNPFGGSGLSGNFRPGAYFAADYCAYPVSSIEKETLSLPENLSPGLEL